MKRQFTLLLLIFPVVLFSQTTQGVVSYTEEAENENAELMRERFERWNMRVDVPDVDTFQMSLYFNEDESIYREPIKTETYDGPNRGRGYSFSYSIYGSSVDKNGYYKNFKENKRLQEKSILNRNFLIDDSQPKYEWKITGRTEQIGQYKVIEAFTETETDTIQAWFTPQIPVSSGPAEYGQLPGLILRVSVNGGKRLIYATQIEVRPLEEKEKIEAPSKGKSVTEEEFLEIRKKKYDQVVDMYGEKRAQEMFNN